ncbi:MAG: cytochrome c peroxidase [Pirellulaceae bacterium]|nr:cytochrome c peroxidase [Pirellulaceae bacterium]
MQPLLALITMPNPLSPHPRTRSVKFQLPKLALLLAFSLLCCSCTRAPNSNDPISAASNETQPTGSGKTVSKTTDATVTATPYEHSLPLGLPEYHVSDRNPMTVEKVALGRKLFFDTALSVDHSMSCATCHDPQKGWSNGLKVAEGVNGKEGSRNVPSILNAAYYRSLFWDGRAGTLESQALGPILNPDEMGMPSTETLIVRLREDDDYPTLFDQAFPNGLTATNVARAIACYERTIVAGNSPYDRYVAGDESALSEAAKRGMEIFFDKRKSKCTVCHEPPTFTALFYHNLGVGMDQESPDLGRYEVTKLESNKGKFKVPTVRDVKDTGPYMHDGSVATLEEVIELYDRGGIPNRYLSTEMRGQLKLTKQEKQDLVTFMVEGLSSDQQPTP